MEYFFKTAITASPATCLGLLSNKFPPPQGLPASFADWPENLPAYLLPVPDP